MPAPETVYARRIVATPAAIDALAALQASILRVAPDEAIVFGDNPRLVVDDIHAIIEGETGLTSLRFATLEFTAKVRPHIEWELPHARPALAQGLVAAVPCKLWLDDDHVLVICASAVADELAERLR